MNGKDKKGSTKNNEKIISFPDIKKRKALENDEAKAKKEDDLYRAELKRQEDRWRAEYKMQNPSKQASQSNKKNAGAQPLINWEKIPLFVRWSVGLLIIVQVYISFIASSVQKLSLIYNLGFVPGVYTGADKFDFYAIIAPFTSLIIHESWTHLGFNLVMLVIMGIFFERQFGARRTTIFFILSGLCGHVLLLLLSPFSLTPVIGASGAISGLFAAAFILMQDSGKLGAIAQHRGPMPFILLWSVIIIALGLLSQGTSWQSHLGGFWGGALILHLWRTGKINF